MNGGKEEARQAGRGEEEENEGMVWRRRNLAWGRRDEELSVRELPPFRSTTGHTRASQEANPEPATARGEVEGGDVEARERAEEAGYDLARGHRHPGRYRGAKQRSGTDAHQRPLGAPSHTCSPRWRSHSRPDLEAPRTAHPSCLSSSPQTQPKIRT